MKKYGKSAAALLLVALVLVSIVPVSAADLRNAPIQVTSFNEFDYIEKIQSYSKEELVNSGVSAEDAERILEFDYKEALFERAQLPANKLEALGVYGRPNPSAEGFRCESGWRLRSVRYFSNSARTFIVGFWWQHIPNCEIYMALVEYAPYGS